MLGNMSKPTIITAKYQPYLVTGLKSITGTNGEPIPLEPVTSLCRCGHSKSKPFCDGTHSTVGFTGEKELGRVKDRDRAYAGKEITIIDNRGVCAHDEACVRELPTVFDRHKRRWIEANGDSIEKIIETIEHCPSGALSYKIGELRIQDLEREPEIKQKKGGPYQLFGWIELKDDMESTPESAEHYTLCRCGESKNKPFCDGAHHHSEFSD